jgi:hypothetical protein
MSYARGAAPRPSKTPTGGVRPHRAAQGTQLGSVPAWSARASALLEPASRAQCAQQKKTPSASTPWPITLQPQCSHTGAILWMAHSNESNVCTFPAACTSKLNR